MSKKMIYLICFVFSFFSIIFMAVFGTLPEATQLPDIEEFFFDCDYKEVWYEDSEGNNVLNKVYYLDYNKYNLDNSVILIKFHVNPTNADTEKLNGYTSLSGLTCQIDILNNNINIYINSESAINKNFTLTIHDKKTGANFLLTIYYHIDGETTPIDDL